MLSSLGGFQRGVHHGRISNDAEVATFAGDARLAQRHDVIFRRNFFFDAAIKIFVLEEDDRIVVADRRFDQTLGVVGAGRANHFQAGRVHEPHLRILRVKRAAVNIAAAGSANHQRRGRAPAIVSLGNHVDDLVEGAADEIHELEFGHRTHAGERRAEGRADDGGLRDGRVDDALRAEAIDEAVGDFERAAVDADVFAETEDGRIALHFLPDSLADGFEIGELRHRFHLVDDDHFKCTAASALFDGRGRSGFRPLASHTSA